MHYTAIELALPSTSTTAISLRAQSAAPPAGVRRVRSTCRFFCRFPTQKPLPRPSRLPPASEPGRLSWGLLELADPKAAPRRPKTTPRRPKTAQNRPKTPQNQKKTPRRRQHSRPLTIVIVGSNQNMTHGRQGMLVFRDASVRLNHFQIPFSFVP